MKYRKYTFKSILFLMAMVLLISSCGRNRVVLPAITDPLSEQYMTGKFVWHDLVTDNLPAARDFYSAMFGWQYSGRGGDTAPYLTAFYNDIPVAGLIKNDRYQEAVNESRWVSYISVPDVDRSAANILENKGIIYEPSQYYDDRGQMALVGDEQGAVFGLITARGGDPVDSDPVAGRWLWNELLTSDPVSAAAFYQKIFGYKIHTAGADSSRMYQLFLRDDRQRAGMVRIPWKTVAPNWLPYIMVTNLEQMITKAESLGAILVARPDTGNGEVAIITDPTGAVFGLQQWPGR